MQKAVGNAFDAGRKSASHKALVAALKEKDEAAVLELVSAAIETTASKLEPELVAILVRVRDAAAHDAVAQIKNDAIRAAWYDPKTGEDDHGRAPKDSAKVERAKASHNGVTKDKIRQAAESEAHVAQLVNGKVMEHEEHQHPADVTLRIGSKLHGLEVKTLLPDAKRDKVTVHPSSRIRKEKWARANKAELHTVAVDKRSGSREIYYRRGVGAYRLKGMTKVTNGQHLQQLLRSK